MDIELNRHKPVRQRVDDANRETRTVPQKLRRRALVEHQQRRIVFSDDRGCATRLTPEAAKLAEVLARLGDCDRDLVPVALAPDEEFHRPTQDDVELLAQFILSVDDSTARVDNAVFV